MRQLPLLIVVLFVIAVSAPAAGQEDRPGNDQTVYHSISTSTFERILSKLSISFEHDSTMVKNGATGYRLNIMTMQVDAALSSDGSWVQFRAGFPASSRQQSQQRRLEIANAWNANRIIAFAYIHPEGYVLETDFSFEGGITLEAAENRILRFGAAMVEFAIFIRAMEI